MCSQVWGTWAASTLPPPPTLSVVADDLTAEVLEMEARAERVSARDQPRDRPDVCDHDRGARAELDVLRSVSRLET
jgi:hypothetical protein